MKYMAAIGAMSFTICGIDDEQRFPSDTDDSQFVFVVRGVEPKDFFDTLESAIDESEASWGNQVVRTLGPNDSRMLTIIVRDGNLYLNRGGCRVLYTGWARKVLSARDCVMKELKSYRATLGLDT